MPVEENKATLLRLYEEVFKKGNLALADMLIANNYVARGPGGEVYQGPDGFKQFVGQIRTALPDLNVTVEHMIGEGDKVAHSAKMEGTFKGELMGIAPTGKKVSVTATTISRFAGGKEVEAWINYDRLSMFQQMGATIPGQ